MANGIYGSYRSHEELYMNCNATEQAPLPQPHQPISASALQRLCSSTGDELALYFTPATAVNAANEAAATDINNNCTAASSFCYFGGNSHLFHSRAASEVVAMADSHMAAPWSGVSAAGPYSRSRYMPYSRAGTTTTSKATASNQLTASNFSLPHRLPSVVSISAIKNPATAGILPLQPYSAYQPNATIYQNANAMFGNLPYFTNEAEIAPVTYEPSTESHDTLVGTSQECPARSSSDATAIVMNCDCHRCCSTSAASSASLKRLHSGSSPAETGVAPAVTYPVLTPTPSSNPKQPGPAIADANQPVTLQITNLDYTMDEINLRNFLLSQLKPITPVMSLVFEGGSYAKVTVPDLFFAKLVVSNLHRKKVGHKRLLVSYTRDSSLTEVNTLRCQVAGLLKDVPYYTLPMYKFRELFQSRFKTSISVLDLYKMPDICTIIADKNEEKFISLQPELVNSFEGSPLIEGLQHSIPYCTVHFKREQHKGWAEQDIEPLPNVAMTISEIQKIIYPLLKSHPGDIPIASLVHCISGQMDINLVPNDNGVNLEHLVCCVQGIQIQVNNFGIKILNWTEADKDISGNANASANSSTGAGISMNAVVMERGWWTKSSITDPLYQISREVIELVKMSPKSTMKFNRFIPAYHNHFGKQCRVADYGYTKLIELFEALASVVQIMGDGENRQITLTHRTQLRRFTSDLLRVLRAHGNKTVLLSQLPAIFTRTQNRPFDVTDYGVCDLCDIVDGLVNSNVVVVSTVEDGKDLLISIPKRKQTNAEIEKTVIFAGEMVELFSNAPQYTIQFQKFVRSYHYHFAYQCRLSDYGFLKLADLMEAIKGVVEMEQTNDEDKKIFLSPKVARRVFAEQCEELVRNVTGSGSTPIKLDDVLQLHKKKFGYQIQPQTLGTKDILEAIELMPYIEVVAKEQQAWLICHNEDAVFRTRCYRACKLLLTHEGDQISSKDGASKSLTLATLLAQLNENPEESISESTAKAMKHAIEIFTEDDTLYVRNSNFMKFLLSIVRLLEYRTHALLQEIKVALNCSINTTSEFGYPNLFAVLAAYADIFCIKLGATQERSEISLQPCCQLQLGSLVHRHYLCNSFKLQMARHKSTRPSRPPLVEHNNRGANLQGPPSKTRAISNDLYHTAAVQPTSSYKAKLSNTLNQKPAAKLLQGLKLQHQQKANVEAKIYPSMPLQSNMEAPPIYTGTLEQQILNNSSSILSNKENPLNSSLSTINGSFDSSNTSLCELNLSTSGTDSYQTSKLWERRHDVTGLYHNAQPNMKCAATQMHPLTTAPSTMGAGTQSLPLLQQKTAMNAQIQLQPIQTSLYELANNVQTYPTFDPPKPDTPPSSNMPFWIDPIWAHNTGTEPVKNDLLNIKLPEIKAFNVLPMIFSPYTLSKTANLKQQVFNFENHDRKIA